MRSTIICIINNFSCLLINSLGSMGNILYYIDLNEISDEKNNIALPE